MTVNNIPFPSFLLPKVPRYLRRIMGLSIITILILRIAEDSQNDAYTPSTPLRGEAGSIIEHMLCPCKTGGPPCQHHRLLTTSSDVRSLQLTAARKLRFFIQDEETFLLHAQQKVQWSFNLHRPWARGRCTKHARTRSPRRFLQAPSLQHRCQICLNRGSSNASMSCVGVGASSSQAGPFLHVAAVAAFALTHPSRPPRRHREASKQASSMNDQPLCEISISLVSL